MKNNTDVKNQIRKLFILNLLTVALSIFLILFNLIVAIFFKNNLNVILSILNEGGSNE